MTPRRDLVAGDEAWCIVSKPIGRLGKRRELVGAARVRVVSRDEDGDTFRVSVLLASGATLVGREIDARRHDLFSVRVPDEHVAFGAELARFWG